MISSFKDWISTRDLPSTYTGWVGLPASPPSATSSIQTELRLAAGMVQVDWNGTLIEAGNSRKMMSQTISWWIRGGFGLWFSDSHLVDQLASTDLKHQLNMHWWSPYSMSQPQRNQKQMFSYFVLEKCPYLPQSSWFWSSRNCQAFRDLPGTQCANPFRVTLGVRKAGLV